MNQHQNRFTSEDFCEETAGPLFQALRHDADSAWFERPRALSPTVAKWIDQEPAAYLDGMNHCIVEGDNPINAVNPLETDLTQLLMKLETHQEQAILAKSHTHDQSPRG